MSNAENHQPSFAGADALAKLVLSLTSGTNALLVTDLDGGIRRVTFQVPDGEERIAPDLRGLQITALFAKEDQLLIKELLSRASTTVQVTFTNVPVRLEHALDEPLFLSLNLRAGATLATSLLAWQLTIRPTDGSVAHTEREQHPQLRGPTLSESRNIELRTAIDHARKAMKSMAATYQNLSRVLAASHELGRQQARSLKLIIEDKDKLIQHTRSLHSAALEAQKEAESARVRLRFLADAGWAFSESLDVDATLNRIANMIVPDIAECCIIDLLDDDGDTVTQSHVMCINSDLEKQLSQHPARNLQNFRSSNSSHQANPGGHLESEHSIDFSTRTAGYLTLTEETGLSACIVAPLRSRNRTFGILTIASSRPEHRFKAHDIPFIEDLALRAAQSLDNSILFHQVQEATTNRERYLSMASHELRSPLAIVSGFGSLLLRYASDPEPDLKKIALVGKEMLQGIERIDMLTRNLLTSASLEASASLKERSSLEVNQLVQHTIERMNVTLSPADQQRVLVDTSQSMHGTWNADAIERAISNVLSNALKYSPDNSPVTVTIVRHGLEAVITICDKGIGLTEAEMEDMFTPFARGETARKTASGTGLGLYITNQILMHHGGRLEVESKHGKGSTFTIHLPLGNDD